MFKDKDITEGRVTASGFAASSFY